MNKITILIVAVFAVCLTGCGRLGIRGNGHITTEQRTIAAFTEIEAKGAFEIEWHNGTPALSITTDENLRPYIENQVSGTKLRLHALERVIPTHGGIKVVVSSPTLNGAKLTGAVRLNAKQISGPKFYFESSGAGRITLDGNVDQLLADMTGATDLNARSLQPTTAEISAPGASKAEIAVSETLRVSITGAGKITYSGNPKTIEKHITGAGSIRRQE
jgi:hypothetical protein